jgi:phosphoglycerate dehydrogenase-like enzyme
MGEAASDGTIGDPTRFSGFQRPASAAEWRARVITVVVEDADAEQYTDALAPRFPSVRFIGIRTVDEMAARIGELGAAEVLITKGRSMRPDIIDQLPELRWVQSLLAGVDRFASVLRFRPGIILTSTRGMHATQMAEMALTQMLVLARDVPRSVRNADQHLWERWSPHVLRDKCVGVVGLGASGQEVGRLCEAVGMRAIGVSRTPGQRASFDEVYGYESLAEAASIVDFLVLTLPYLPDTEGIVGEAVLSAMKPSSFLINIARGGVVDEDALVRALQRHGIAGAALDVFRTEPLPPGSALWDLPNVFLTSHMAGMSEHYVEQALRIVQPNLDCYLSRKTNEMANRVEFAADPGGRVTDVGDPVRPA